ncbi:MAG: hypothetical protein JO307_29655 [Bryobacterales bacterium]|nr:hypothetical protein [Bryobacterales bacterium]MBV9399905.1 hypothetical protein [Bryobacterales bacterium]
MKKYIRAVLDDLRSGKKDYFPPVPKPSKRAKTIDLDVPPAPVIATDLDNQELSKDPEEMVRQLDWQAQQKVQNPGH